MDIIPAFPLFAAFLVAVLVITVTPGPDMTLFLGKALTEGRAAGLAALAGALVGCLVHTTLVALGLSALIAASATAFLVLKVVGALYLLWLAAMAIRHGSAFNPARAGRRSGVREPLGRVFMKGLAVNLLNPKIIMFFVTFLPQFVDAGDPHATGKLMVLGLTFVVVEVPLCALMILFAASLAGLLGRSPRVMRAVDYLFAGVFAAFALRLVLAQRSG